MATIHEKTKFGPPLLARFAYSVLGVLGHDAITKTTTEMGSATFAERLVINLFTHAVAWPAQGLSKAAQRRHQGRRDQRANEMLAFVGTQQDLDFSLYLRAFSTEGKMPVFVSSSFFEDMRGERTLDLEALLGEAVEPFAPLVALGKPGEQFGAGRIHSDETTWREKLGLLAQGARFIFVLPSDSAGTKWEVEWVQESGMLGKCLFVMPPENWFGWTERWEAIAGEMCRTGIRLPPYQPQGQIFTMNNAGGVEISKNLDSRPSAKNIRKLLEEFEVESQALFDQAYTARSDAAAEGSDLAPAGSPSVPPR